MQEKVISYNVHINTEKRVGAPYYSSRNLVKTTYARTQNCLSNEK